MSVNSRFGCLRGEVLAFFLFWVKTSAHGDETVKVIGWWMWGSLAPEDEVVRVGYESQID